MLALVLAAMLLIVNVSVNAAEIACVLDSPVELVKEFGEYYAHLEANGRITIRDRNHKVVSTKECNATLMTVLDNSRIAAISVGEISFYKIQQNSFCLEKTVSTGLEITALTNLGEMLFIGTKTGRMYKMSPDETKPQEMPGSAKTEITGLAVKRSSLIICSLAEDPRLLNLDTGYIETFFVSSNDPQSIFVPTQAIAFKPEYYSMDLLVAQASNVYVYDASVGDNLPVKRLPKSQYNMQSPVFTVSYSHDSRFILAGLQNNTAKYIDTARTDNKGNHVVSTRTGFSAGSLVSLISHPNLGIVIGAGKNLYVDSSGGGKLTLSNESNLTSTYSYEFVIENTEDGSLETRTFDFGYYSKTRSWILPQGTFKLSSKDANVVIKNNLFTIDGINPVTVSIFITEPSTPEKPRAIVIRPPQIPLRSPDLMEYVQGFIVSAHQNWLKFSGKNSSKIITLQAVPYALRTDAGKALVAFPDRLEIYSCATGDLLNTMTVSGILEHLAYKNEVTATAVGNKAAIFINGKLTTQIEQETAITSLQLSSDGKVLLIATGRMLREYQTESGNEIPLHTLPGKGAITLTAFSGPAPDYPSARYFAFFSHGDIKLCDGIGGQDLKTISIGNIDFLRFEGNDKIVFHDITRNTIRCITINSETIVYETTLAGSVFAVLPDEVAAFVDQSGLIVLRKQSDDLAKIGLTESNAWFFTVRDKKVPELFQASDSIAVMFTNETGRLLTQEEVTQYRTAELPIK